jgi:DNA invertase Pin-like site-specific DNA recombinase
MTSMKPLCGYRRLSVDRHGTKIGPRIQTDTSEAWAAREGLVIGQWYEDKDTTAADEDVVREGFEQMLSDLAAGMWGGIATWRIDRLVRLSPDFERCFMVARRAGGFIVTTHDGMSTRDPNGLVMLRMQTMFADAEVAGMKTRIKANKAERRKRGAFKGGGRRPFGFAGAIYDESGEKVVNSGKVGVEHVPHEVALLRDAAHRIARGGESYGDVIKDWHSRTPPVYGAVGSPWNPKTLQSILTAPRIVGKQVYRATDPATGEVVEELVKAVWEPVIDEATWTALKALARPGNHRGGKRKYLLSGAVFCGQCGGPLTGAIRKYPKGGELMATPTYRCRNGTADKERGSCGKLSVIAEPVDKLVAAHILTRLRRTRAAMAGVLSEDDDRIHRELEAATAEVDDCDAELNELAAEKGRLGSKMKFSEWAAMREPIERRRDAAERRQEALRQQLSVPTPAGAEWSDLPAWWEGLTMAQQRKLVSVYVQAVRVLAPGRSGRHFRAERVVIAPADAK